jgi:hypothetical protein
MTAMDEATELANAVDSKDPRVGLRAVAAPLAPVLVPTPRAAGWSWQEIASELGVSRQAVHKKHAARRGLLRRD